MVAKTPVWCLAFLIRKIRSPLEHRNFIGIIGVFSFSFIPKKSRFWSIILHNGIKHYAKFLAKRWLFSILDSSIERQKKTQKRLGARAHPRQYLEKFGILDGTKAAFSSRKENFWMSHRMCP
jgi:hypothetical protein